MKRLAVAALVLGACNQDHFLVVTIDGRPSVHDVATIRLALGNEGSMRSDDFPVAGKKLPVTFALSSPDRAGELAITAQGLDDRGVVVGSASAITAFVDDSAALLMEGTDFVVNTAVADDQFLSIDYNANGNQLAATADGDWIVTYRGKCTAPCELYARRFDKTGAPVQAAAAASSMAFTITTTQTLDSTNPAVAGKGTDVVAVWDFATGTADPSPNGVACRAIDATGATLGEQATLAVDSIDMVAISPLSNGNFSVVWTSLSTPGTVTSSIVNNRCLPVANGATLAVEAAGDMFQVPAVVGGSDGHVMYTWINNDTVFARVGLNNNLFITDPTPIVSATTVDRPVYARVVPFGGGFGVVTRWIPKATGMNLPGRITLTKFTSVGVAMGPPIPLSTKTGGDFATVDSFGATTAANGMTLVVWHACGTDGDASGCGVFGRFVRPEGTVGEQFTIPTTVLGDQTDPSVVAIGDAFVVAWNDLSMQPPDTSGSAVRARIVYAP